MRRFLVICAVTCSLAGQAIAADEPVDSAIERLAEEVIQIRHHIHRNPELSNREFETAALVAERLRALKFDHVQTGVAHTGVVGILKGGRPGPVIAVRADMDALPVTEQTDLPFKSTVRTTYGGQEVGVAHACGHDIHTAVQLGVASVLSSMREQMPGTVKFIFQPAEEGPPPGETGGAPLMIQEGVLEDPRPEAIFALHTYAHLEVGKVGYTPGPALAAIDHFRITIHGRQAHGASPHLSVDPIVIGAQVVQVLQTIRSRNLPPLAPSVLTVGIFRSGTRFNIIPGSAYLEGTVRTYNADVQDTVEQRMRAILGGVTQAGGGSFELQYERVTPVTVNDPDLTKRVVPSLEAVLGDANVKPIDPWMAGEDFAYFANEIPGFYFRLGTLKPGTTSGDHHAPTFRADDGAVPVGMRTMAHLLWNYLSADRS